MRSRLSQVLAGLALAVALLPGCAGVEKCAPSPCPDPPTCLDLPACARNRVHVFLIAGIDPLCALEDLREGLIAQGFIKVYAGTRVHGKHFAKEIQRLRQADEHARFAIVSQGSASGVARDVAGSAGAPIDLIVFLDETGVGPAPAGRVVFIHGEKVVCADDRVAVQSVCLSDAGKLGTAGHPQAAALIAKELCAVAAQVPVIQRGPPCELGKGAPVGGGWDFLRPDGRDSGCVGCKPMHLASGAVPATVLPPPAAETAAKPATPPARLPNAPAAKQGSGKRPTLPLPPLSPKGRGE